MFHRFHFRQQIFHINKFINGKGLFSNWQKLSTTQSRKDCPCIIQYKHQELCQYNQFCSGNSDGPHSLPVENANSSSTILSPETPINNVVEQKEQQRLERAENRLGKHFILETRWLELDNKKNLRLKLKLERGKSGQHFFYITLFKNHDDQKNSYTKILVPQDSYAFIGLLDQLIGELATENFEQKLQTQDPKSTIEIVNNRRKTKNVSKLKSIELLGKHHKFQLELLFIPDGHKIKFGLLAYNKISEHETYWMILPLQALPWLRNQMAEMLEKYDGTEEIVKESPTQIPQKFFPKTLIHAPSLPNSISSGHSLKHKGMRPQFVNKNSSTFKLYPKMANKIQNSNQSGYKKQRMPKPLAVQQKHKQTKMDEDYR